MKYSLHLSSLQNWVLLKGNDSSKFIFSLSSFSFYGKFYVLMGGQLGQKVYFYIFEHFKRKSFWWPTKIWIMHNPVFNISASRSVSFHIHCNRSCTIKNNNMESHIQIVNDTSMENWYLSSWHMTKRFYNLSTVNHWINHLGSSKK